MKKMAIGLILLCLLSCSREKTIRMGMIVSVTGNYSPLFITARNGALLAVEEINNQEKVKIDLVLEDDESDTDRILEKTKRLVDSGIDILIMSVTSAAYSVVEDYLSEREIFVLSPTVSSSTFRKKDDNLILLAADTASFSEASAEYALRQNKGKTAIVYDHNNRSYAQSLINSYSKVVLNAHPDTTTGTFAFDSKSSPSYSEMGRQVELFSPETVLIIASPFDSAFFCQHIRPDDYLVLLSPWSVSDELIENGGKAVENSVFFSRNDLSSSDPKYLEFVQRYAERFRDTPSTPSLTNYDALYILHNVIRKMKSPSPEKVKAAIIEQRHFEGILTTYNIDAYGDCTYQLYKSTVQNGQFVRID